jgi:hypothetical protein
MHFHFYHLLVVAVLAIVVQSNSTPGIRANDMEPAEALGGILENSINFEVIAEAIIMPRIEEWLVHPFDKTFSSITNSSSVITKVAEYVVESEGVRNPNASFAYSSNENETMVEFEEGPVKEVKLTLLYRASEHGFLASEFHSLCDGKGPTITLVKAVNGRLAAAYSSVSWGRPWGRASNPQGFLASIVNDPGAIGGYSLQKYAANDHAFVQSHPDWGPDFGTSLPIADRCNDNERSYSYLGPRHGYGSEGVERFSLFGVRNFGVLEYEVFRVEIESIV